MRHRYTRIVLLFCLWVNSSLAQQASISAVVKDKITGLPLQGATVSFCQPLKPKAVTSTVTDSAGKFVLPLPAADSVVLQVSFIGFVHYRQAIAVHKTGTFPGVIFLEPMNELLQPVTVSDNHSALKYELDKKVYQVGKDILSQTGSLTEILQNIPSLSVDINGNVTLRSSSNLTFFINGRPSALLKRNSTSVLEQIPANTIERIEVITNPSAQYSPEGVGGIINIVLKKEVKEGFSGLLGAHAGTENRYNANLSLNYGAPKVRFFSGYGIRHAEGHQLFSDERAYRDSSGKASMGSYHESGTNKVNSLSHTLTAGVNYLPDKYNTIELSGNYFVQHSLHQGRSGIATYDSLAELQTQFVNHSSNDEDEKEGEAAITIEHNFKNKEDHSISLEATWSAYREKEDHSFHQIYSFPPGAVEPDRILTRKSGRQQELLLDHTLPLGEDAELESGYAGEFTFDGIRYLNHAAYSQFLFQQQVHALYTQYGQSFGGFSFKTGLRAEGSDRAAHLELPFDSLIRKRSYKVFPTLHTAYEVNDACTLSLSYSKRINRPDADELNPNPEFADPRNAEAGNPALQPEQVHSLELGYLGKAKNISWVGTFYFRHKYDAFTSLRTTINDSVVLTTTQNLNSQDAAGLELVLSENRSQKLNCDLTGNVFYTTLDAANLGYATRSSAFSGNIKLNVLINPLPKTSIQLNSFYFFPSVTPQGRRDPYFYLNGGVRQQLFKGRASAVFTVTDLFHTYRNKNLIRTTELDQTRVFERKGSVIYFGFKWKLKNYKEKDKLQYESEILKQ